MPRAARETPYMPEGEGDEDVDGEEEDGDDGGQVTKRKAVDDVGGRTGGARVGHVADGVVGVGGVVLGDEANYTSSPEPADDTDPCADVGAGRQRESGARGDGGEVREGELVGEEVEREREGGDLHQHRRMGLCR